MSNPKDRKKNVKTTVSRKGHQLPARVDDATWEVLRGIAKGERRSVAQTVIILIEEALAARGKLLPPAASPE